MFTGIIAAVGTIERVTPLGAGAGAGVRLWVRAGGLDLSDVALGDSIALQGACMTVVERDSGSFVVDVSRESLSRTVGLSEPGPVNLEKAMRLGDRIGGHLVTGHVDAVGEVVRFEPQGESMHLRVAVPAALARQVAYKGSITVDGVSLTVNAVEDVAGRALIDINLIPHTVEVTTLGRLCGGAKVNLEIDLIARYVARMLAGDGPGAVAGCDASEN